MTWRQQAAALQSRRDAGDPKHAGKDARATGLIEAVGRVGTGRGLGRMNGDAHNRRTQQASVKTVAGLEDVQHGAVGMIGGFDALEGLMDVWVEALPDGVEALETQTLESVPELAVDQLKTFAVVLVGRGGVGSEGALEAVEDGEKRFDDAADVTAGVFNALAVDALAEVLKVGLASDESSAKLLGFGLKLGQLVERGRERGRCRGLGGFGGSSSGRAGRGVVVARELGEFVVVALALGQGDLTPVQSIAEDAGHISNGSDGALVLHAHGA